MGQDINGLRRPGVQKTVDYEGNLKNPKGFMKFEYTGGWDHKSKNKAKDIMRAIEILAPDKYQFIRAKDVEKNGRFDVTLYKTKKDMENETNGTLIHSKKGHLDFPDEKGES